MPNIKDVAQRAGLSTTLVSRYLNGQKGVSAASKEKIQRAIEELNYRPNGLARSLVRQETQSIGIVLDTLCAPFISPLINGLERGAEDYDKENKYNVVFCSAGGDLLRKQRQIHFLSQGRVDGIIIYGSLTSDDSLIASLAESHFPFLLIENDIVGLDVNKVLIDNMGGAYRATKYLIELGHRRIVHVAGNMNLKITLDRINGFVRALQDNAIPLDNQSIIYPTFKTVGGDDSKMTHSRGDLTYYYAGCDAARQIMARSQLPDAIFFATDISAFGAIDTFAQAGIRVPQDISVVGFDDENPADYQSSSPLLTTVRQPLENAGYTGIKTLIRQLKTPSLPAAVVRLDTELVIRETSVRPKSV